MTLHRYLEIFWSFDGSESCTKVEWVVFSTITILLWVGAVLIVKRAIKWWRKK